MEQSHEVIRKKVSVPILLKKQTFSIQCSRTVITEVRQRHVSLR
jgi:hypothetical protein